MMPFPLLLLLLVGLSQIRAQIYNMTPRDPFIVSDTVALAIAQGQCTSTLVKKNSAQTVFKVGVLGNRGIEKLYQEYNLTFAKYLTSTVGPKFDPPIRFEIFPLLFGEQGILDPATSGDVDFTFMNPALYSCVESEAGANSLATFINRRVVQGEVFEMSQFGGVIFVRSDNKSVNSLHDIAGKRVATTSVTSLGSGQMQFRELQRAGLHHFQSLKQLIMMESQGRVVDAVILGEVDVGFVRTDQLERSTDPRTGEPLDLSELRIVASQEGAMLDNGDPFPVALSTPLYPEWNFASLPHVSYEVMEEVQSSLLSMGKHSAIAAPLAECYQTRGCSDLEERSFERSHCEFTCFEDLDSSIKDCSIATFPSTALLAAQAMANAKCAGWIPSKSYMTIRNMQEETGFIKTTPQYDEVRCTRTTELIDSVVCPAGHFRRTLDEILTGCVTAGLDCYGYQCLCSPCVKKFDVDFYPVSDSPANSVSSLSIETRGTGCEKFSICGEVAQGDTISFRVVDNKQRAEAVFWANVLVTDEGETYNMTQTPNTDDDDIVSRQFTFDATDGRAVGTVIVQVYVDGEQIAESPFRFRVVPPVCDYYLVPSPSGSCVCQSDSIRLGNSCWELYILLPIFILAGLAGVATLAYFYIQHKHKQMDAIWKVDKSELIFDDPPRELGQGTFGLVLLGEYRGTAVAVKKVHAGSASFKSQRSSANGTFSNIQGNSSGLTGVESGGDVEIGLKSVFALPKKYAAGRNSISRGSVGRSSTGGRQYMFSWFTPSSIDTKAIRRDFIREMRTLSKLRHPCIVGVMGAIMEPNEVPTLIMEWMSLGSLGDLLQNESMVLTGETLLPMLQDIASGVRFLHSANPTIIHGDIKSNNILVDARFHAKVSDFGLSSKGGVTSTEAAGTPFWMAPELLREETGNTTKSDVYAFGITISEILSRKDPFHGEQHLTVLNALEDSHINKVPDVPATCSPEAKQLMLYCLKADPAERPTAKEIDVLVKRFDPSKFDLGIKKSLRHSPVAGQAEADLLSQLFPKHIADALREGRSVEPESHECVTVYFSDIVGYTEISSTLSPAKVGDLLHRLYSKFDDLCEKYDLFKVETVGDAYMVATLNEGTAHDNHVAVIARFSFDAIKAASETFVDAKDPTRGYVQIRCGFHSGPVVTHVVGHRNPRYSVIGDVVNTASRMESNSTAGRVSTSKTSADLLRQQAPEINLTNRGTVIVKGKGKMNMFWVGDK